MVPLPVWPATKAELFHCDPVPCTFTTLVVPAPKATSPTPPVMVLPSMVSSPPRKVVLPESVNVLPPVRVTFVPSIVCSSSATAADETLIVYGPPSKMASLAAVGTPLGDQLSGSSQLTPSPSPVHVDWACKLPSKIRNAIIGNRIVVGK